MTTEARLESTPEGLEPADGGWFIVNVADAAWYSHPVYGDFCRFEGSEDARFGHYGVNMDEAANPDIAKLKSIHGHVVIRVSPGGDQYHVIIVDDTAETFKVTAVHGPYSSRSQ